METPNIALQTSILGIGPNAESTLAENFEKIDTEFGKVAQISPDTLLVTTLPEETGPIAEGESVATMLAKLQSQISPDAMLVATLPVASGAIAEGDSVATMLAKLQSQIDALP